jgi:hypothetical protein
LNCLANCRHVHTHTHTHTHTHPTFPKRCQPYLLQNYWYLSLSFG